MVEAAKLVKEVIARAKEMNAFHQYFQYQLISHIDPFKRKRGRQNFDELFDKATDKLEKLISWTALQSNAGWRNDLWPLWFPVLVFGPFIGDATLTLAKRLARGERVWEAHRSHYYQRLVRMGFGHRRTALIGYAVMLACAATALAGRMQPPPVQAALFAAASALLAAIAVWVDLRWRRFLRVGGAPAGAAR